MKVADNIHQNPETTSGLVPEYPSQFSVFVQSWLGMRKCHIVELGCGNGRDALFFHNQGHQVTAIDQLIPRALTEYSIQHDSFTTIENTIDQSLSKLLTPDLMEGPIIVYSRFFQHALSEDDQYSVLSELSSLVHKKTRLFFEFRLDADKDIPKHFGVSDNRRFQSSASFIEALQQNNLDCVYSCEGQGFALFEYEDAYVGRFIAKPRRDVQLRIV